MRWFALSAVFPLFFLYWLFQCWSVAVKPKLLCLQICCIQCLSCLVLFSEYSEDMLLLCYRLLNPHILSLMTSNLCPQDVKLCKVLDDLNIWKPYSTYICPQVLGGLVKLQNCYWTFAVTFSTNTWVILRKICYLCWKFWLVFVSKIIIYRFTSYNTNYQSTSANLRALHYFYHITIKNKFGILIIENWVDSVDLVSLGFIVPWNIFMK